MKSFIRVWIGLVWALSAALVAEGREGADPWAQAALDQALLASREIRDPFHRVQVLAAVAEAQVSAGETAGAVQVLHEATRLAEGLGPSALAGWAFHDVAIAWLKAGDAARADATASAIDDPTLRDSLHNAIADHLRIERAYEQARAMAVRIEDGARQGRALRSIAIAQAAAGDFEGALATARSIVNAQYSALALGDVAAAIARDGDFAEAERLAVRIRAARARGMAMAHLVAAQVAAGAYEQALMRARAIDDRFSRAEALARIASATARLKRHEQAQALFSEALATAQRGRGGADLRCAALIEIAREQLVAGDPASARKTLALARGLLGDVRRRADRLTLITHLAPLQVRAGDARDAVESALQMEDATLRPLLVRELTTLQAEGGDVEGSITTARRLLAPGVADTASAVAGFLGVLRVQRHARDEAGMRRTIETALDSIRFFGGAELEAGALAAFAAAQAAAGDRASAGDLFEKAMKSAARIPSPYARAHAYARIADALGQGDS